MQIQKLKEKVINQIFRHGLLHSNQYLAIINTFFIQRVDPCQFVSSSYAFTMLTLALLGRAAPALSTPLFFMCLRKAYAQRPIKKGGL
jgi:hypothetical protein